MATLPNNRRDPPADKNNNNGQQTHPTPQKKPRTSINAYRGWTVPQNNHNIQRLDLDHDDYRQNPLTPRQFYQNYILLRRPVILHGNNLDGVIANVAKLQESLASFPNLRRTAGHVRVSVEKRLHPSEDSSSPPFGNGNEIEMTFSAFLDLIESGDTDHYLTTQDVRSDRDGRPELMAPFMKLFREKNDSFPLRPPLMGNLIPQNINLWIGNGGSAEGSSSGLHHDYHDNLYIVLKGKKRFRLFDPLETENMYTRGELLKVHPNGRINYRGEETTAYGADLKSDAAAEASRRKVLAEEMLEAAERDVERGVEGAEERLEAAETMLDEALDAILDAEDDGDDGEKYEEDWRSRGGTTVPFDGEDDHSSRVVDKTVKYPNNFSKVDHTLLDDPVELERQYPKMSGAKAAFAIVNEGECLYLPASWFHEVTSYGGDTTTEGHIALNYWFHPPDAENDFENPYSSEFWPNDYRERIDREIIEERRYKLDS
ncbi:hypothetical protein ACHAXS_010768 [Conticribra weissflogii]